MALLAGNTTSKLALAALGLALAFTPVIAEAKGGPGPRANFEQLDTNGDGALTQAELEAHRTARFMSADADGDGNISREELEAQIKSQKDDRMTRRIDRMMERVDTNSDGVISSAEIEAAGEKMGKRGGGRGFERADADGDGSISKAEFENMSKRGGKRHQRAD